MGTLQSNRRGIPDAIKQTNGREPFSYKYFWESEKGRLVLHSYVVKTKSTGLRNALLLSTVQPILGVSKNPKKKPAIYKLYDYTKGGTDIIDQRMGTYSCHTKSRRWTMAAFSYVLVTCRVNASTVFALNKGQDPRKQKSFNFVLDLASELILPQIKERRLTGLQLPVICKVELTLRYKFSNSTSTSRSVKHLPKSSVRKRCGVCCSEASGPGQKKRKEHEFVQKSVSIMC